MMFGLRRHEKLGTRLAVLLSIALLPIGALAGLQTYRSFRQGDEMAKTALLGRTAEAAASERALILQALGAGEALAPSIFEVGPTSARCSEILRDYVNRSTVFVFAGFTSADGTLQCASRGAGQQVTQSPGFKQLRGATKPVVMKLEAGSITGLPVVIVAQPIRQANEIVGYLSISMPFNALRLRSSYAGAGLPFDIVTYNARGDVITANSPDGTEIPPDKAHDLLPDDIGLSRLTGATEVSFTGTTRSGEKRQFSVVPIVPDLVFALGSVRPAPTDRISLQAAASMLFPLLMWVASILVAYVSVDRLVIRHVRELRSQMRRFALGDRTTPPEILRNAPAELQDVSQTFHNVGRILIRDEQQLANSVREKTALLKEIHHRVKNNLQLIASIMNMQIRQVREPTAKAVLKSVQDRVMSLASVHRRLYQAENLAAVQADELLGEIVAQLGRMAGAHPEDPLISTDIDPVVLTPDDAVPVALLTTEAVTNALKYARPRVPGQRPTICVSFKQDGAAVDLSVANSIDANCPDAGEQQVASGLGSQLMNAFAAQLGAALDQAVENGTYRVQLRIRPSRDDSQPVATPVQ